MPQGDFGGKRNTAGFDKNPQNINKTGQNRKSFASINKSLREKGITPVTKKELLEAYGLIFNSTEIELLEISRDKECPYALKLILLELNTKATRSRALADFRDYLFGRAKEHRDITSQGGAITMTIDEQLKKLSDLQAKMKAAKKKKDAARGD